MTFCTRCRGTGEITNSKGKVDACPDCVKAAETAWRDANTSGGKHGRDARKTA